MLTLIEIIIGTVLGLVVFGFVLPIIPHAIPSLSNNPNRFKKEGGFPVSGWGFFTELQPGRAKIIERGGRFIECVMKYEGYTFLGLVPGSNLTPTSHAYWDVVSVLDHEGAKEFHPLRFHPKGFFSVIAIPWWCWKWWVYKVTGYVFTGIYPFQKVRTYPIEWFEMDHDDEGNAIPKKHVEFTDHYRVADFQFPTLVGEADTQDKIQVKVQVGPSGRIFNPYQAAYAIDNWPKRLTDALLSRASHFTRARPLEQVLTSTGEAVWDLINDLKKIGDRVRPEEEGSVVRYGIELTQILIPDISPARREDAIRLGELARARVDADVDRARGQGRADAIEAQRVVVMRQGGNEVLAAETTVRTAEAAGDGAIIILGGAQNQAQPDPLTAANLRELRNLNK